MSSKNPQIFVTRLPGNITQDELRRLFKKFGPIRSVSMKRGYGFVVGICWMLESGGKRPGIILFSEDRRDLYLTGGARQKGHTQQTTDA